MIKAILWDVDGTILDFKLAEKEAVKSCFKALKLGEISDSQIESYSLINKKYWERLERGELTKQEVLLGRFKEFFSSIGIDESFAEPFNDLYQVRLGDTISFFPGAMEMLCALKGKVVQCAVTNGTKKAQSIKLKNSGLESVFDKIYISEDIGFDKPDKRFFGYVFADLSGIKKDEIIIVGDSPSGDIAGGINAGIRTCLFCPNGKAPDVKADYIVDRLEKIIELLEEIE